MQVMADRAGVLDSYNDLDTIFVLMALRRSEVVYPVTHVG
jgi:hypothetical protein